MALAGKRVVIKASTNDVTYNNVLELNDASLSAEGENIDVTEFGDDWINRIQGLKDVSLSLSGFWAPADTTGQVVIRNSLINDTDLFIQYLPDGTNGFKAPVKVATFEISAAVDGAVEVSIDLEGNGAVVPVP